MKKLSLILVLAVIAVALVALMVACDPPGGETQQVYFNSNNSDIALLYEQGTTNSPSTVLNSGESATFDVAIANKYDPATLTATAKNAKVSLKVTGSVDSAAMIENGYTVVGKLTISDITGTAEINFSAEEADISFNFVLAGEEDGILEEMILSDDTKLSEATEDGYTYKTTYSELQKADGFGIILSGPVNGKYQFQNDMGEQFIDSSNELVSGFFEYINVERDQYIISVNSNVMAFSNEITVHTDRYSKQRLQFNGNSGSIIEITRPEDVDIYFDGIGNAVIRLKNPDGQYMTGTIDINGTEIEITDAQAGYALNKMPVEYCSDELLEDTSEAYSYIDSYNISTEYDMSAVHGACSITADCDNTAVTISPYRIHEVYYYDKATNTAWIIVPEGAESVDYILEFNTMNAGSELEMFVNLTGNQSMNHSLYQLPERTNLDQSEKWLGGMGETYLQTDNLTGVEFAIMKYNDGQVNSVYVNFTLQGGEHFEIELR